MYPIRQRVYEDTKLGLRVPLTICSTSCLCLSDFESYFSPLDSGELGYSGQCWVWGRGQRTNGCVLFWPVWFRMAYRGTEAHAWKQLNASLQMLHCYRLFFHSCHTPQAATFVVSLLSRLYAWCPWSQAVLLGKWKTHLSVNQLFRHLPSMCEPLVRSQTGSAGPHL